MKQKIAVLLDGPVVNDGRVRRIVNSLSQNYTVDLYSTDSPSECAGLFNEFVQQKSYQIEGGWYKTNIAFHTKFSNLERLLAKSEYDAVYCNDYPMLHAAVQFKQKHPKCKLIYDTHELYIATINQFFPTSGWKALYGIPLIALNRTIHRSKENRLVKSADLIITVGESIKNEMEKLWNVTDILVIKNCPNLSSIPEKSLSLHEQLQLNANDRLLIYQGFLNRGRGVEKLIDVADKLSPDIHVIIVGDGPLTSELKLRAAAKKNVHFTGRIPFSDLLRYTMDADAGIMLIQPVNRSKELALPNKLFEYMAAGIPFITNKLVESTRILDEIDGGYTVNDKDIAQLAMDINAVFSDPDTMKQKGRTGKKAIQENYNWENESKRLVDRVAKLMH